MPAMPDMEPRSEIERLDGIEDDAADEAADSMEAILAIAATLIASGSPVQSVIRSLEDRIARLADDATDSARMSWFTSSEATGERVTWPDNIPTEVHDTVRDFAIKEMMAMSIAPATFGGVGAWFQSLEYDQFVRGSINRTRATILRLLVGVAAQAAIASIIAQNMLYKTAAAVIDGRTTSCCRQVNGQRVPVNAPFVLTGEPRFADKMYYPPFHWGCRTRIVPG